MMAITPVAILAKTSRSPTKIPMSYPLLYELVYCNHLVRLPRISHHSGWLSVWLNINGMTNIIKERRISTVDYPIPTEPSKIKCNFWLQVPVLALVAKPRLSFAQHGATVILLGRNVKNLELIYDEIGKVLVTHAWLSHWFKRHDKTELAFYYLKPLNHSSAV